MSVTWTSGDGISAPGYAQLISPNSSGFYFFSQDNIDLVVKVLDARTVNNFFWLFYGSLTDVEFTLTVTDTVTGAVKIYTNPLGHLASFADLSAFDD